MPNSGVIEAARSSSRDDTSDEEIMPDGYNTSNNSATDGEDDFDEDSLDEKDDSAEDDSEVDSEDDAEDESDEGSNEGELHSSPSTPSEDVDALLVYAAQMGNREYVQTLLQKGANLEASNSLGQTSLSCAAEMGHEDVVDYLLENGATLETESHTWVTPLAYAAGGVIQQLCAS